MKTITFIFLSLLIATAIGGYYFTHTPEYIEKSVIDQMRQANGKLTPKLQKTLQNNRLQPSCRLAQEAIKYKQNIHVARYLLEQGFDIKPCTFGTPFPFYWVDNDTVDTEFVQFIIDNKLGLTDLDDNGYNVIHQLSRPRHEQLSEQQNLATFDTLMTMILAAGADINLRGYKGRTPVHLATSSGFYDILERLLKLGANPNIENDEGASPLLIAATRGDMEKFELLVSYGAKLTLKGEEQDVDTFMAEHNRRVLQQRKQSWPGIIYHWQQFMLAHEDYPKNCAFALYGGTGSGIKGVFRNNAMNSVNIHTIVDAFAFGGCDKAELFHYRIVDSDGKILGEEVNLHWGNAGQPLLKANGEPAAFWFNRPTRATLQWFTSNKEVNTPAEAEALGNVGLVVQ